jgi:DNA-directed RNA polymerase subunit RPC12/RpoP
MEPAHEPQHQQQLSLASREHTNIIKGKRTKRVRPQSPIPFSITANSSTEGGAGGEGGGTREDCNNGNDVVINNNNSSPTTSYVAEKQEDNILDEEYDMANCLILLAQGQSKESPKNTDEYDGGMMNYTKYSSRKFMEAATLDSGRAGYYVYECKTCNRTFPSFQALGGHRASHKKPKALAIAQERKQLFDDDQDFQFKTNHKSISLQFNNNGKGNLYAGNNNNKSKVHECSICGSEFTSGQALGGHMRRHRAPVGTAAPANTTLSLTPMALEHDEDHQPRKKRNVLSLDLDLNLPAPEDEHRESKFAFASKQQQQQHGQKQQQQQQQQQQTSLVFSSPALVDCHY